MLRKAFSLATKIKNCVRNFFLAILIRRSGFFIEDWYIAKNPDVRKSGVDSLQHYLNYGGFEGRDPGPRFSSRYYLDAYSDVKASGMNPLVHYIKYGQKESRTTQYQGMGTDDLTNPQIEGADVPDYLTGTTNYSAGKSSPPATLYDTMYSRLAASTTIREIWHSVYGEDYPGEVGSLYSFITMTELTQIVASLAIGRNDRFIDIACGQGDISLWVALQTGASVIGIDYSKVAVRIANSAAQNRGLQYRAEFIQTDASKTNLISASQDGAISIDSLHLMADPLAVIMEVARLLKSGAVFAFTTWEIHKPPVPGRAVIHDYHPLLEKAGFQVEKYDTPVNWRVHEEAVYRKILECAEALKHELGDAASAIILDDAARKPDQLPDFSRVLIVARKMPGN